MFSKKTVAALGVIAIAGAFGGAFAQQSSSPGLSQRLGELLSASREEELLEPDRAFSVRIAAVAPNTLTVELAPAGGYYLYRERMHFALKNAKGVTIKSVALPRGAQKDDPTFGKTETYDRPVRAEIALDRAAGGARSFTLSAAYQGCHEKTGVCYPPMSKDLLVSLP